MIPNEVYNHVKYSHGGPACGPTASMKFGKYEYVLSQEWANDGRVYVICVRYLPIPQDYYINQESRDRWHNSIKRVSLACVPEVSQSEWDLAY